jgi:uncharacterized DUF497 family protein
MPEFEWDENKNKSNQKKHGLSFEDARDVFEDKDRIQYIQNRNGERRWRTVGSILGLLFSVVYTVRSSIFRLISARRASKKEKREYLDNQNRKYE